MPVGTEVGLSPGDFVLDGDPAPYPKRGKRGKDVGLYHVPMSGALPGLRRGVDSRWS